MKTVLAVISLLLQSAYVLGLIILVRYAVALNANDWTTFDADPRIVATEQLGLLKDFSFLAAAGGIGFFLAWFTLRIERFRPNWYRAGNQALAVAWVIFVPIGTAMAIFMLRWCRIDTNTIDAS